MIARGLPAIPTPTIGATTGDTPGCPAIRLAPLARVTGFALRSQARPSTPTESSSRRRPARAACVSDWSFSFRCSPPRVATTQFRFDTARLFTAQQRTSTAPSSCLLRRTSAGRMPALPGIADRFKGTIREPWRPVESLPSLRGSGEGIETEPVDPRIRSWKRRRPPGNKPNAVPNPLCSANEPLTHCRKPPTDAPERRTHARQRPPQAGEHTATRRETTGTRFENPHTHFKTCAGRSGTLADSRCGSAIPTVGERVETIEGGSSVMPNDVELGGGGLSDCADERVGHGVQAVMRPRRPWAST